MVTLVVYHFLHILVWVKKRGERIIVSPLACRSALLWLLGSVSHRLDRRRLGDHLLGRRLLGDRSNGCRCHSDRRSFGHSRSRCGSGRQRHWWRCVSRFHADSASCLVRQIILQTTHFRQRTGVVGIVSPSQLGRKALAELHGFGDQSTATEVEHDRESSAQEPDTTFHGNSQKGTPGRLPVLSLYTFPNNRARDYPNVLCKLLSCHSSEKWV